jgi:MATE family multidrug resistance protein
MKQLYSKYRPHYIENLKLAIPVVISQLGHILVQTSDTIIVGHFAGTIPLAAVALTNNVFMIPMMIGMGISYGITPLIAQENGRNNFAECGRLLSNSLFINVLSGILLFAVVYLSSVFLINRLDQTAAVVAQTRPVLQLMGLSIIPMLIFNTFKQFAEGLGFTKQAMMISIWGNVLNICLGIIFVKGLFGVHPMGVKGVGYSTLIDRSLMAVVMGVFVFRSPLFRKYLASFAIQNIDRLRTIKILQIGAPIAMQYTFEVSAFSGAGIMVGTIGAIPQAAHQVAINMAAVTYMMAGGISAAAAIKSGNYLGAKNYHHLKYSAISSYHIALVFMFSTALLFTFGNHILPWIYTEDKAVIQVAAQLLIIAGIFQLFDGAQVVGLGILRGMGDVNIPTIVTFLAYWVVGIPVGYLLGLHLKYGVNGIWIGLVLGLATASVLLYLRFLYMTRKHELMDNI